MEEDIREDWVAVVRMSRNWGILSVFCFLFFLFFCFLVGFWGGGVWGEGNKRKENGRKKRKVKKKKTIKNLGGSKPTQIEAR